MMNVVICGSKGKMGAEAVKAVNLAPDMQVVAEVYRGVSLEETLKNHKVDVVVELTHPSSVYGNIMTCLDASIPVVVGTTGLTQDNLKTIQLKAKENGVAVIVCPNFAVGAILMMQFAQKAAKYMQRVEIIERHHDKKHDAPSGTALRTAELIAKAAPQLNEIPLDETEMVPGARGGDHHNIPIHSVRLPGVIADQDVIFGAPGQTFTLTHRTVSRESFMPGVLLCIRKIRTIEGLVVGLEHLMED